MVIIAIYLIISLLLENIMSNIFTSFLGNISIFSTIYTVISLVVIYSHFSNKKKYFITLVILGIIFDIVFTGTFLLNTCIFIVIGIVIAFLNNFLPENIFGTNIISIASVIMYHLMSFIILNIVHYSNYNLLMLVKIITHSFIMTIIYTTISYFLIDVIYKKFNIKDIK